MQLLKSDLNPYSKVFLLKGKEGNPAPRTASKLGSRFFVWFLCPCSRLCCGLPFFFCSPFSSLVVGLCWLAPLAFSLFAAPRSSQETFFEILLICWLFNFHIFHFLTFRLFRFWTFSIFCFSNFVNFIFLIFRLLHLSTFGISRFSIFRIWSFLILRFPRLFYFWTFVIRDLSTSCLLSFPISALSWLSKLGFGVCRRGRLLAKL